MHAQYIMYIRFKVAAQHQGYGSACMHMGIFVDSLIVWMVCRFGEIL